MHSFRNAAVLASGRDLFCPIWQISMQPSLQPNSRRSQDLSLVTLVIAESVLLVLAFYMWTETQAFYSLYEHMDKIPWAPTRIVARISPFVWPSVLILIACGLLMKEFHCRNWKLRLITNLAVMIMSVLGCLSLLLILWLPSLLAVPLTQPYTGGAIEAAQDSATSAGSSLRIAKSATGEVADGSRSPIARSPGK